MSELERVLLVRRDRAPRARMVLAVGDSTRLVRFARCEVIGIDELLMVVRVPWWAWFALGVVHVLTWWRARRAVRDLVPGGWRIRWLVL